MSLWPHLRDALRTDSTFWRRALHAGVQYGPEAWVRYSPPVFGAAFAAALPGARHTVRDGLRQALGRRSTRAELEDVTAVFANFASSMTEAMLLGTGRGYRIFSRPVGAHHFWNALDRGRGVILATAQTAGWDVASVALQRTPGHRRSPGEVWVLMEREPNAEARALHDRHRHAAGVRLCHVGDDPLESLPVLRHLRQGGVVALKFDRLGPHMRARAVELFGRPWRIPEGPLSLAALSGAAIVPNFSRRLGFLDYEHIILPPLELPRRPSEAELDTAALALARALETFVRRYPTQWFRFHAGP